MKKSSSAVASAVLALVTAAANAGETGTINRAGPYEATMQFYLHPAHGFPGKPEPRTPAASTAKPQQPVTPETVARGDANPRSGAN